MYFQLRSTQTSCRVKTEHDPDERQRVIARSARECACTTISESRPLT
jgi:hypothetical protein